MAQYCDSAVLEKYWFNWGLAATVPSLEPLRTLGVLYSRVCPSQIITHGLMTCNNPWLPLKEHYLPFSTPTVVSSVGGVVNVDLNTCEIYASDLKTHQKLLRDGFILEKRVDLSWSILCLEVKKLCEGISRNFFTDDENRIEIEQEAFTMVISKIKHLKLCFFPGKAPVFNYLTTAIHRCIYNYLRKVNRHKKQMADLQNRLTTGCLDTKMRSYRTVAED